MTMPGVEAAVTHAVAVGAEVWVPLERVTDEDATREDVSASYARGVVKRVDESAMRSMLRMDSVEGCAPRRRRRC